ncbi:MAG: UDP-N-acetylmuramoyl-L-alanyl-D-glutamate--2,6-diaminopimelate ligase [Chloroflexi bacterium]|nr:UDP-N-acetylmuramoyl-L-alanyl-D-glutamate--2,6-diaminopimelate ligase [Chloroflexota bacterium]
MRLGALLESISVTLPETIPDCDVGAIRTDSRCVRPGDLFVAYPGVRVDGRAFIDEAKRRGACAVVVEGDPASVVSTVPCFPVRSGREAWALLCRASHGFPDRALTIIGITGTDGKTTTATMLDTILRVARRRAGLVTTVGARTGDHLERATGLHTTTPDPPELFSLLGAMRAEGRDTAILEVTSHALAMEKVAGIEFDVGVITNVTRDHLDFHRSPHAYLEAKARLFDGLGRNRRKPGPAWAILNADDRSFERLSQNPGGQTLSYGIAAVADVGASDPLHGPRASTFTLRIGERAARVTLPAPGAHNVLNALAAAAAAHALESSLGEIAAGLESFAGVPGRYEIIEQGQPFSVIVDFAHTPEALRRVLTHARGSTTGRLIIVIGCAGERDAGKRFPIGAVAGSTADLSIVTNEDPRGESPGEIAAAIERGIRSVGGRSVTILDRDEAISHAIGLGAAGDTILLAGKGHEQSLCIGDTEHAWDDREAARRALAARGYGSRKAG